jgi:hypothetical protein
MISTIARGFTDVGVGTSPSASATPRPRRSLLDRCSAWLRRRDDAARLHEMDPRMARDIGAAPGRDGCPQGFAVDPRPLWGVGLTPQPTETTPPWSSGRRRD